MITTAFRKKSSILQLSNGLDEECHFDYKRMSGIAIRATPSKNNMHIVSILAFLHENNDAREFFCCCYL